MSARVVNPFSLTEMRRLREAVVARPFRPDPEARARLCRNLWGKSSADDSRAFAAKEMAEHRERDAERWGFDFAREVPLRYGPGAGRYNWTKVLAGTVSSAYRMPRMDTRLETARATVPSVPLERDAPRCREPQRPEATATAEAASPLTAPVTPMSPASQDLISPPASTTTSAAASPAAPAPAPTRQTSMTDYLQARKRSRSDMKSEENPAKRRRNNNYTQTSQV